MSSTFVWCIRSSHRTYRGLYSLSVIGLEPTATRLKARCSTTELHTRIRIEGLEPPRISSLVPKTNASANSAISAKRVPASAKIPQKQEV